MRAHENVNSIIVTERESVLYYTAAYSANIKDCPERNPTWRRDGNSRFWHDATGGRPSGIQAGTLGARTVRGDSIGCLHA
jgi:hypothetical protein